MTLPADATMRLIMRIEQFFLSRIVLRSVAFAATTFALLSAPAQAPRVALMTMAPTALASASDLGPVPASQAFSLTVTLAPTAARKAALDSYLTALTTPSSASYHQWLTPQQFATSYGATADQLAAATVWAQGAGLTVGVSAAGTRMTLTGSAAQVEAALGVQVDTFQTLGYNFYAPVGQPTLPAAIAPMISGIAGLTNMPADGKTSLAGPGAKPGTMVNGVASAQDVATLGGLIDANVTPILSLDSTFGTTTLTQADLDSYSLLFKQAAAQGMTTILARTGSSLGFPSGLAEVTVLALAGDVADQTTPFAARPSWQAVAGLPVDGLRHAPDLTSTLADFTAAMTQIAGGTRLGNINPVLYELAPKTGLYSQAGAWTAASGLGAVDLKTLAKVYPRGTGSSFTSFQATNYSPIHGQGTSFTSNVTSGTGGATPTGTVSFLTSAGVVLGTSNLTNGTGSITVTNLDGGNYTVDAVYSGDATYASSTSPSGQLYVQPEPSALSVAIGGTPTIGGSYTVTVTDTAPSGVGTPTGPVTVTVSGTSSIYTANLVASGTASSQATVTIPATTAGTLTLSIQCTTTPNYSCYNPYTTTVTIAKATPTLTISSNPATLVSGQTVTLNAAVSTIGNAAAPTGAVTFFDNGTTLNAGQLTNGATQTTGTVPTTATHSLSATYAGDANYNSVSTTAGSTSSGTIATSLNLQSSASVVTAGQTITFTATLTPAQTGPATPTGTVNFFDGSTLLATANLVNNTATFSTAGLSSTANHTITAVYSGDGYYTTSTSNAVGLSSNNTSNVSTTTLVLSPTNPVHGSVVTFTATVSGSTGGAVPTGTVTFSNTGAGTLGTASLSNGVATFQTNQLPGGTSTFTAAYGGNTAYNPSFSSAMSVTVSPEPVTLTVAPATNAMFGTPFNVLVTVTGASGVSYPTGSVTVTPQGNGYSAASSAGLTSGGTTSTASANVMVQATGAGSVTFTATYAGDKNFAAAGPSSANADVAKAASTTTVSFSPTMVVAGQQTTVTAHVGFVGSIGPTGTVQFFDGTTLLGTAALGSNGSASLTTVFAAGNHSVTAVYSGDTNYAGSTSAPANTNPGTVASTTSLTVTPGTVVAGGSVTLAVTVGPTTGTPQPTGTVQVLNGSTLVCTLTLTGGQASCLYAPTTAGSYNLTANCLGDANFAASSSLPVGLTVTGTSGTLIATMTGLTASPSSLGAGITNLTATVVPASASSTVLTGSVAFFDGTTPLGSVTVTVAPGSTTGTATLTPGLSATVTHALTAVYSGDTIYAGSTSTVVTSINGTGIIVTSTMLTAASSPAASGATVLTAVVTPASAGATALTGTITFYDGTTPLGIVNVTSTTTSATGSITVTLSTTMTHSLTAVYSGDSVYASSKSAIVTGITPVTKITPVLTLTATPTTGITGAPVVLTATLVGITSSNAGPTGTVTFYATTGSAVTNLGASTLGTTGPGIATATLSTVSIPTGSTSVYAVYSGDANFSVVTSNIVAIGQGGFSLTFTPQSLTLFAGQTGTATIVVNAANGFTGTIVFGCTPPASAGITCSVSPTVLVGAGTVSLTVQTIAPSARATEQARLRTEGLAGGVSLAALLCWLLPAGRRRRIPALLLVLLALSLATNLGCSDNSFVQASKTGGTPLGTSVLTIVTAASDGTNTVRQSYPYQVTVQ